MKKYTFEKIDENLYKEKLENGIEVYLYPTKKTKNFYVTISVKYGSRVESYEKDGKVFDVIPGSAHFLEHKVMAISENKEFSRRINELGSFANAWTNYYGTNYNIFGSSNLKENIKLLLDIFYNININDECVDAEKGIIGEEIDMNKDKLNYFMHMKLVDNMYSNSYVNHTVVGERSDIEKIDSNHLNQIYNDFYLPNNTFIGVYGDFNKNEILDLIKEQLNKYNLKSGIIPKRIVKKEKLNIRKQYEEINKNIQNERVKIGFKMSKDKFNISDDNILKYYFDIILSCYLDSTGELFEKYKKNNLFIEFNYGINVVDDYINVIVSATAEDGKKYIDNILKDIKNLKITKEDFERKKKVYLKFYITSFDNIEDIEYDVSLSLMMDDKIDFNEYSNIINMNVKDANNIISNMNFDNYSILVVK